MEKLNRRGWSSVHWTSHSGCVDIVQYLIDSRVNIDIAPFRGTTPLMIASLYGHLDVVKCLVENGAQVNRMDQDGKTALFHFEELKTESEQINQIEIIKYLVLKGSQLDHVDIDGTTFLGYAIATKNLLLVKYAIQNGFDVNQPVNEIYTPLTLAIEKRFMRIVQYLIGNGADVIQCDGNRNMDEELIENIMMNANTPNTLRNEIENDTQPAAEMRSTKKIKKEGEEENQEK